ncbi:ABC transporter substrate-binding protein [Actinobacteria bacterium YIM 96077]|uniref:ABC transporter substrate-binding protein n=1 Tax=Phytoactinopolyspora halophila TaxID=1981511 RepID=A0A329QVX9_9ACTN|nr:ABC transporter substrate-binding protein [Actinobacteria bacterium YIM 96077]RAW16465.1 ABC transporter substrate-binding protein [Phytoactinopolyspora halophila]
MTVTPRNRRFPTILRFRAWRWGAAVLAASLALAACDTGEGVDVDGDEEGTAGDAPEGGTLIAAIGGEPDQFDPHVTTAHVSFQVLENVYDTLVAPDAEGEYQPSLARDWSTSDDELTWTFELRDDVTFHDGSDLTADDVVYSYNRIIEDELANAYKFSEVDDIEAVAEHTVEITLNQPTPALLDNLGSHKGLAIIPEGADEDLDLVTEAVGTGPFELGSPEASGVTITAYENHWNGSPTLDAVEFRYISEATTALTSLRAGDIHWTDNIAPQAVEDLQGDEEVELGMSPSVDYWYLALNQEREPWDEVEARQAIAYGIDREQIVEAAQFGAATINQTAIPEHNLWHHEYAPYEHNPDEAASLLESAGVDEGQQLDVMVVQETEGVQIAQALESQLADIGIEVTIEQEPESTWLDRQSEGDFDAFMWSWVGNLDPFGFYHAQHVCDGGLNFQGYCNPDVDELLNEAAGETDQDARKELYDQAAEMIVDDVSYLYLYNPDVVQAWVPGLDGYEVRPDRATEFENVTLPE